MGEKVILKLGNNEFEFPLLKGTAGQNAIDITLLLKTANIVTYDPGFNSTASCKSAITFIDGEKGVLLYRGYKIEDLAKDNDFVKIAYLLLYSNLPNSHQYDNFLIKLRNLSKVPKQIEDIIRSFPPQSHPMAILIACFAGLAAFYHNNWNTMNGDLSDTNFECAISAISQVPVIIAMIYRHITGQEFIKPDATLSYTENFVKMMFNSNEIVQKVAKALDLIFVLHADHEQNASTAAVRLTGSTGANVFACISSAVATLWGPAHGGANEAVINMLMSIKDSSNLTKFVESAKNGKSKLMGFGHRVYKNYDPRAKILKAAAEKVLQELGIENDPLLNIALKLEETALSDSYFIERKLYPNVDFYSGIILKAIGVPVNMFTTFFALARTVGWVTQWHEMINDEHNKINRPRQLYIGEIKD